MQATPSANSEGLGDETITIHGKTVKLSQAEIRLDLDSPLESTLTALWVIAAIGGVILVFVNATSDMPEPPVSWFLVVGLFFLGVIFYICRQNVDCTYILDNGKRCLDYYRDVFGANTRYSVCSYDKIASASVSGVRHKSKHSTWWTYQSVVILDDATVIKVSDPFREDLGKANTVAHTVGQLVGCNCTQGLPQHELLVTKEGGKVVVKQVPWNFLTGLYPVLIVIAIMFIFFFLLPAFGGR